MCFYKKKKRLLPVITLIACLPILAYCQYTVQWPDKENLTAIRFTDPNKKNGFMASISLVALFTSGTHHRDGFRLGLGANLAYQIDNWFVFSGLDIYKEKTTSFGPGITYLGSAFFNGKIGGSYLVNRYLQGDKQTSSLSTFRIKDFELKFENDFLAIPFTGFKRYDRFRTAAIEVRYKTILFGVNVYTSDMDGVTDFSYLNKMGVYRQGKQISSPLYVGYTDKGLLVRCGINNRLGGFLGQNKWHRKQFDTPDFKEGTYNTFFIQTGTQQPYTLY